MFGSSYFGKRFFADNYFPPIEGVQVEVTGGGSAEIYYKPSILAEQIRKEDEEIIMIVMSFMGMMK